MIKPGVLFVKTPSGGVLMDVARDRFLSLNPLSADIWSGLSRGLGVSGIAHKIGSERALTIESAQNLVRDQIRIWERAHLIGAPDAIEHLPQAKPLGVHGDECLVADGKDSWASPTLLWSLYTMERRYRRAMSTRGFSNTLTQFQKEFRDRPRVSAGALDRVVRSYHLLRRGFRQGTEARDCLFRSLAVGAVLRRHGLDAQICIGIIDMPFAAHAWVELDGRVVNDNAAEVQRYTLTARF